MKHFQLLAKILDGFCVLEVKTAPRIPGNGIAGGHLDQQDKILPVSSPPLPIPAQNAGQRDEPALKFHFASANSVFAKQARFYFPVWLFLLITRYRNQGEEREMNLSCLKELD